MAPTCSTSQPVAAATAAPPSTALPAVVTRVTRMLRWLKYYAFVNGFICTVAGVSFRLVSSFHAQHSTALIELLALYVSSLMRIVCIVMWFEWIASRKPKIYGDKRHELTTAQRRAIYGRILWLVVPTECLSYWVMRRSVSTSSSSHDDAHAVGLTSFLVDFASFIPKSLAFEIAFDLFHYVTHWTCHQVKWLYQHVHKRHHWHLHPSALSTYEQDAVDLMLTNVLPWVLASRLSPAFSPVQLHLLFAYKTYVEVAGHCGLELKGFSFPQMPLVNALGICLRIHDHDLHHTHPRFNFAKRFALWDKLFCTFQPGRPLEDTDKPPESH